MVRVDSSLPLLFCPLSPVAPYCWATIESCSSTTRWAHHRWVHWQRSGRASTGPHSERDCSPQRDSVTSADNMFKEQDEQCDAATAFRIRRNVADVDCRSRRGSQLRVLHQLVVRLLVQLNLLRPLCRHFTETDSIVYIYTYMLRRYFKIIFFRFKKIKDRKNKKRFEASFTLIDSVNTSKVKYRCYFNYKSRAMPIVDWRPSVVRLRCSITKILEKLQIHLFFKLYDR